MSVAWIAVIAAGALFLFLLAADGIARAAGTRFFSTVILGENGRTSTSKTFILMWTLLVGWALVALLIGGELVRKHTCVPSSYTADAAPAVPRSGNPAWLLGRPDRVHERLQC